MWGWGEKSVENLEGIYLVSASSDEFYFPSLSSPLEGVKQVVVARAFYVLYWRVCLIGALAFKYYF